MMATHWLRPSLAIVAAATLLTGCVDEGALGPAQNEERLADTQVGTIAAKLDAGNKHRGPDLEGCQILQAPADTKLVLRVYATGVQIYHWNGTSWAFDGPSAVLFADAAWVARLARCNWHIHFGAGAHREGQCSATFGYSAFSCCHSAQRPITQLA
ncbi:MAG: hypothetical protein ACRENP_21130 [Longimicrobiales bacterium]